MAMTRAFVLALLLTWCARHVQGEAVCDASAPRVDCGYFGISLEECEQAGCCWNPENNEPWCFQKSPSADGECLADGYRGDCGYVGVNEQGCKDRGCCWSPKENEPWCFHRTKMGFCRTNAPRYDCGWIGVDENGCRDKGCCWNEKENEPWCFHSTPAYVVKSLSTTALGVKMTLELNNPGGWNLPYGASISPLTFELSQETDDRLHVKIDDPTLPRWEVPESMSPRPSPPASPPSNPKYVFTLPTEGEEFFFTISRSGTGEVVFDTRRVGVLQFSEQYLQLGTSLPPNYNIYGLGERETSFRLKPGTYTLFNKDVLTPRNVNLYGSHPFYMEHRADGQSHGVFLRNSNGMDVVLNDDSLVYKVIGGIFEFYFFLGPSPEAVVQQYQEVIGRPWLPPYWALGFHNARFGYPNVDVLDAVVTNYQNAKIPLDGMWVDIEYMDGYRGFTLHPQNFPKDKMQALATRLHDSGQRMVIVLDPGIKVDKGYSAWDNGLKNGIFVRDAAEKVFIGKVWPGLVGYPDFFHPKAEQYWTKEFSNFYNDLLKVDGLWLDMNEASNFCDGQCPNIDWIDREQAPDYCPVEETCIDYHQRPGFYPTNPPYTINNQGYKENLKIKNFDMDATQHGGIVYYDSHNLYGLSETIATNHALEQVTGKRAFVLSRSTFPGSGQFTGHWLGDNQAKYDEMYLSIAGMLNFQLFGIPYVGADICGFQFDTTEELCGRWMEIGSFYPFSRSHNIDAAAPQEPYVWPSVAEISRHYLGIRYSLLPYYYTLFYKAHRPVVSGIPPAATVVRPLFFEFPTDATTFEIDWQFMLGSSLLITPVLLQGATSVRVYFPPTKWYDWYTHRVASASGGEAQELDTPWDRMQIHIKAGTVTPMQEPGLTAAASKVGAYSLLVALNDAGKAQGDLFLDDGESIDETLSYSLIKYEAASGKLFSKVEGTGYAASVPLLDKVTLLGIGVAPSEVTLNGNAVTGVTFDPESGSLTLTGLGQNMGEEFNITW